ncbi:MAG: DUF4091 domain-containing protein [Chlorobi bacterium]|nr:DUF4091 domain-containing protein [Chlorobiota bacterium]
MKKIFLYLFIVSSLFSGCRPKGALVSGFTELSDPDSLQYATTWGNCSAGLNAAFGSTDIRYARTVMPENGLSASWAATGWKGERIYTQVVLWSSEDVISVKVSAGNLTDDRGNKIDTPAVVLSPVGYVITDAFLNGCSHRDKDTIASHLAADILHHNRTFNIPGRTARPVWVSVNIPVDAPAGKYTGNIFITALNDSTSLTYNITVQGLMLPPPSDWSFHLDLWQNPFAIARFHKVPLWSEEHWQLIRKYLVLLADAGQKCITTSIIDHPWHGQTYDPFGSMITWLHSSSGEWDYDYAIFDQYIETAMDAGITAQINCYTMVPGGNRFSWFEEDSSGYITRVLQPGSQEYEDLWRPFLWDFREHLREREWLDKTTIAMDERNHKQMAAQLAFLKETAPEFKVTLAGHYYPDLMPAVHDFSFNWRLIDQANSEMLAKRRNNGKKTTFYVACGIPYPNTFTFSPPSEATFPGWVAAAYGFDGFLRWAYNSWPETPLTDSRFITWPAGDTYLIYPGPLSSIRFEKLREGIQDYEKIRILEEIMKSSENTDQLKQFKKLKDLLENIRGNPESAAEQKRIEEGKKLINLLTGF